MENNISFDVYPVDLDRMTWYEANGVCNELGWRLPTSCEVRLMYKWGFIDEKNLCYWSSDNYSELSKSVLLMRSRPVRSKT